jgi:hypothetical protein
MNSVIQKEFAKIAFNMTKRSLPKKQEAFSYKEIADDMWRNVWAKAKEHFSTIFDWENNDSIGQKRVITFTDKDDENPDISFDYKFNCDLWCAGGDWEYPSYYFKCQIVDGSTSVYDDDKLPFPGPVSLYRHAHFILIPPKEAGNNHLISGSKTHKWVAIDNSDVSSEAAKKIPELDSKKAWEWLEDYLKKYIDAYFKNKAAHNPPKQPNEPDQTKTAAIDYSKYFESVPKFNCYLISIPIGITPPSMGNILTINNSKYKVKGLMTPSDYYKGKGAPVARSMEKFGIAYRVNLDKIN